jgi:hypothetical protein
MAVGRSRVCTVVDSARDGLAPHKEHHRRVPGPEPPIPLDMPDPDQPAPRTAGARVVDGKADGNYLGPDGHLYSQADLTKPAGNKSWKDLTNGR